MLPKGWRSASVTSVCSQVSVGIVVNPSHYYVADGEGVRAFRSGNVRENAVQDDKWVYLSDEGHRKNSKSKLRAGDVLVVRTGFAGTACVVPKEFDGCNCIDILFARPDLNKVVPDYLAQLTNSQQGRKQVFSGQSGLAQKHLNVSSYSRMTFALPPVREQRQIVEILSTWDQAIATSEQLVATARRQKLGLTQSLVSCSRKSHGKAVLHREHASAIFSPRSVRRNDGLQLLSVMQDVGVVPRSSLDRKVVMPEGSTDGYKLVEPGDFVISLRSFEGGLEYSRFRGLVSPAYTVLKPTKPIVDDFYRHYFKSQEFIGRLAVAVIGIRDGKQISYEDFEFLRLPYPPFSEQQAIADVLNAAEKAVKRHEAALRLLRQEKAALMSQLLTGKRRVKLPEAEAETQA